MKKKKKTFNQTHTVPIDLHYLLNNSKITPRLFHQIPIISR